MNEALISLESIWKSFSTVTVLQDVNLQVYPGEILALLGENGAGKSTLMKIMTGIYRADRGTIYHQKQPIHIGSPREAERLGISMIHQELFLVPNRTVAQNIFLGREPRHKSPLGLLGQVDNRQLNSEAAQVLKRVGSRTIDVTSPLTDLTVAQQQLVEIAKALSTETTILLMDEPTSSLSEEQSDMLLELMRELKAQGLAIVFTTHRLPEAFQVADRFAVLRDGKMVANVPAAEATPDQVIQWMVGRPLDRLFPKPEVKIGEPVLEVRGLSGGLVQDVDFTLNRGEILGFGGLIGAGRTEIARLIFGADKLESGHIALDGQPLHVRTPVDAVKAGIGLVPEDRKMQSLILDLAVRQNMVLPGLPMLSTGSVIQTRQVDANVSEYIQKLNIRLRSPQQQIRYLSGGNQQKVVLSKWLMLSPKVLILDEPTRGIDVGAKAEIYELIGELARSGIGVILISSDMPELLGMSDRVVVVAEGRVMRILQREEATPERIMSYASIGREIETQSDQTEGHIS